MENSEPKQVCRRNALAFLGYAAVFALTASPAMLAVSPAEAQPPPRPLPPRPRHRPQTRQSLGQSAVRSGEAGELNGARNGAPDAQNGVKSGAQDATSAGMRETAPQPPPSQRSSPLPSAHRPTPHSGRLSAGSDRQHSARPAATPVRGRPIPPGIDRPIRARHEALKAASLALVLHRLYFSRQLLAPAGFGTKPFSRMLKSSRNECALLSWVWDYTDGVGP